VTYSNDLKFLRTVTDEIMEKIQELSKQEYVDMYASEAKIEIMKKLREERKASGKDEQKKSK
jgi:1-acyl-sn-glycerol-3-phosphate acyltransferase